jgi:hypothetical protein
MNSKEYIIGVLGDLGYTGSKSELRKEYKNLFVVIKPQSSRFGDEVYLNFGIIYKPFVQKRVPKYSECQLEFRYRQLMMALKRDEFKFGVDDTFHDPQFTQQFMQNMSNVFEKMISEFDDLERMRVGFPNNIPVLDNEEEDIAHIIVISYFQAENELIEFFAQNEQ